MQTLILPDLRYDCLQCGKGCVTNFQVLVNDTAADAIRESESAQKVKKEGYVPIEVLESGIKVMARRPDNRCVLLREDKLCAIHAEAGIQAKPRACRQFPFHPINTPAGQYIGLSFFCSAVQRNAGRRVAEQEAEIQSVVGDFFLEEAPAELHNLAIPLGPGITISWPEYLEVEAWVLAQLKASDLLESLWEIAAKLGLVFLHHLDNQTAFLSSTLAEQTAPSFELAFGPVESIVGALISIVECPEGGDERGQITESYIQGKAFHSPRLGTNLRNDLQTDMPSWFDQEVYRYFEHVIFRKFLTHGPIIARAFTLCCLHRVLRFYTMHAQQRAGRSEAEREDYYFALDTVEIELMLHADGLSPLYDHLQYTALQILDPG